MVSKTDAHAQTAAEGVSRLRAVAPGLPSRGQLLAREIEERVGHRLAGGRRGQAVGRVVKDARLEPNRIGLRHRVGREREVLAGRAALDVAAAVPLDAVALPVDSWLAPLLHTF